MYGKNLKQPDRLPSLKRKGPPSAEFERDTMLRRVRLPAAPRDVPLPVEGRHRSYAVESEDSPTREAAEEGARAGVAPHELVRDMERIGPVWSVRRKATSRERQATEGLPEPEETDLAWVPPEHVPTGHGEGTELEEPPPPELRGMVQEGVRLVHSRRRRRTRPWLSSVP